LAKQAGAKQALAKQALAKQAGRRVVIGEIRGVALRHDGVPLGAANERDTRSEQPADITGP
jgi:hypothetical protein